MNFGKKMSFYFRLVSLTCMLHHECIRYACPCNRRAFDKESTTARGLPVVGFSRLRRPRRRLRRSQRRRRRRRQRRRRRRQRRRRRAKEFAMGACARCTITPQYEIFKYASLERSDEIFLIIIFY